MIRRIGFLAITILFFCGIFLLLKDKDSKSKPAIADLSVTVVLPRKDSIAQIVSASGVTIAREEIQIMTELSGLRVKDILVDVGDIVEKDQIIAFLDGQSQVNMVEQFKGDYERAKDAFVRVDRIKDTGAVSKQLVIEKRAAMQVAKALLDNAELNLKRSSVISPEAGVVFERKAKIGGVVSNSEPLFRIARNNEIEIEALVAESELSGLKIGHNVTVVLTGEDIEIEGKIRLISPYISDSTRMASVRITLPSTKSIPIGLFATVRIMQSEREGLTLPKTAIQQDSTGHFVWVINLENKAERCPVKITSYGDDKVMVEGVSPDYRVVARAGAFIKDGDTVNVVEGK
jgi:HlyD family secretion protein